jgi:hypothetical protein
MKKLGMEVQSLYVVVVVVGVVADEWLLFLLLVIGNLVWMEVDVDDGVWRQGLTKGQKVWIDGDVIKQMNGVVPVVGKEKKRKGLR